MAESLTDKVKGWATHPHAVYVLGVVSFVESMFFPIPADVLFIPMVLLSPERFRLYASVATVLSCLGSVAGYYLGMYGYEAMTPFLSSMGILEATEKMRHTLSGDVALLWGLLMSSGFFHVPPIKVVTIGSGIAHVPFMTFMISAFLSRGLRFFLLGWALGKLTPEQRGFFKKHASKITLAVVFGGGIWVLSRLWAA